ncbi:MAG: O-antigen ligase domain-containing protein [bacterium]|jgi:hypothetical protein|nr:O-antigen ligase domain-containing protein [Phycisphaerales bacterium]MCE2653078.1 hypothetical protein [Planctomycetaceae bacterium]
MDYAVLFTWPLITILLFSFLPAGAAVLTAMLGAWLFLPMTGLKIPGFPDITKMTVACFSVMLATVMFDAGRFLRLKPSWLDLPMLAWCGLVPFVSALAAGWGPYEGLSGIATQSISWGIAYLVGRLYFQAPQHLTTLARAIVIGGLIYAPLCWIEMRMSPQLHNWIYGYHQHFFGQSRRGDAWRPTVFMQHGLMVSVWMSTAALLAAWLAWTRSVPTLFRLPMWLWAIVLLITAALCRSTGATLLMIGGAGLLAATWLLRTRLLLVVLISIPITYAGLRTLGNWDARQLDAAISAVFPEERAGSLRIRLDSETQTWMLLRGSETFGRGRFDFLEVKASEDFGRGIIPDGYWVIVLGIYGLVGLSIFFAMLILPPLTALLAIPAPALRSPAIAAVVGLSTVLVLYVVDCLSNAMLNPIFTMIAGGLVSVAATLRLARRQAFAAQHRTFAPPGPLPPPPSPPAPTQPPLRSGPPRPQGQ